jgi:hypothetical protein
MQLQPFNFLMGGWQASPSESCREGEIFRSAKWQLAVAVPGKVAELAYRPQYVPNDTPAKCGFSGLIGHAGGFMAEHRKENRQPQYAPTALPSGEDSFFVFANIRAFPANILATDS